MSRYYALDGEEDRLYVVLESPDRDGALIRGGRAFTREELLAEHPAVLAAWEAGDDSRYWSVMAVHYAEDLVLEAHERAEGSVSGYGLLDPDGD